MYTQLSQGEDGDEGSDGDGDDDNNYGEDVHWDGEESDAWSEDDDDDQYRVASCTCQ